MNKRYVLSAVVILIMFAVLLFFQIKQSQPVNHTWTAKKQREYASKLKAENLIPQAISAYLVYLDMGHPNPKTEANIYYLLGKMAESQGQYENALSYFYKVELIDPGTALKQELGKHLVACLEKMGRGLDAQYTMDRRTSVDSDQKKEGKIIARIGKEKFTNIQLNEELQKLPSWIQKEYSSPEKRAQFLKDYLAMQLLWRKAQRLGLDKDPQLRQKLDDIKKELAVQKLLETELQEKIDITPDQVKLYYQAHMDKFVEPVRIKIAFLAADSVSKLDRNSNQFREITSWIKADNKLIPGIGEAKDLVTLALGADPQTIVGPEKAGNKYYLIKVLEKEPQKQLSFESVQDRCAHDYGLERQKIVYQGLVEEALRIEDVEIYDENI